MTNAFRILIPTDFSETADQALAHGLYLADRYNAEVHLLHAFEIPTISVPDLPDDVADIEEGRALSRMNEALDALDKHHERTDRVIKTVRISKPEMPASEVIVSYAEEIWADLIVIGTHGRRGVRRMLLGSVAEEVIRNAACPVFAVRHMPDAWPLPTVDRVLVPIDFSDGTDNVINQAVDLATHYDASLTLLHVVDVHTYPHYGLAVDPVYALEEKMLRISRTKLNELAEGVKLLQPVEVAAVSGEESHAIVDYAEEHAADLIVMGSHGRTGVGRLLLGSVAETALRTARCPVVIVPTGG